MCRSPALSIRGLPWALAILAGLIPPGSRAADPQPYDVVLTPTGDAILDGAVRDSSSLVSLRDNAPVGPFALVQRALDDSARFQQALNGLGYYKGRVSVTIGGTSISDPALIARIDAAPAAPPLPVVVTLDRGPVFRIERVEVQGEVPTAAKDAMNLSAGADAVARDILAARDRLLSALRDAGYPMASVTMPPATIRPDQGTMDVTFVAQTGPHADLGPIRFTGLRDMDESFMRERLLLHPGQPFNPPAIEAARQDLMSVGVFSVVRMIPANRLDAQGNLPLVVDVTERPLHAVDLGAAYSTDLGASFNATWRHRNLFGGAEQLNISGAVQLGGNAVTRPGYQAGIQFIKPDFLRRDQSMEVSLNAVKQSLQAYDQTALIERFVLSRKLTRHWTVSVGLLGEQEQITQEGIKDTYHLVGLPITVRYDSTNSQFDPVQGIRATVSVMPMHSLGANSGSFVISQAAASTYIDMLSDGRSVLALRGLVGQASGVGVFGLPPDQRFYAGGSGTVRGFRYQSVGPQFASGNPTGGNAVAAGTVEFRQRILSSYGVVAFIDAGQVSTDGKPFSGGWRAGAGIGARYYTAIGPIRLDVAVPLNRQPGGDAFELYIGIGQAF